VHPNAVETHKDQHAAENRAVTAATVAMDKRLDQMNEFREQLRDQATSFVRRETLDAFIVERRHALEALGNEIDKRYEELRNLIATEREERRANEGVRRGMNATTAIIVTAIGVMGTVLGIVVVVVNLLTGSP
jgi:biopolymer transport protein ExbB/TolQ